MVELTILEALNELKLIKSRIHKQMHETLFIDVWKSDETKSRDSVCRDARSKYQSIGALLSRRQQIKAKIMQSNATTKITIGSKVYTVAEAISMKDLIDEEVNFLNILRGQRNQVLNSVEMYNRNRQAKIDNLLEKSFSRDNKSSSEEIKTITEMYQKNYFIETIDPLSLEKEIEKMEEHITTFQNNVDTRLSYSNAVTKITVDDN